MNIRILNLFLALLISFQVFSQKKEMASITENELRAHLEFIASDLMQGRDFDTPVPGLEITGAYLKAQCRDMGLKPGAEVFSQTVKLIKTKADLENSVLQLKNSEGEVIFSGNNIVSFGGSSKTDTLKSDLVFGGFGYLNKSGYNDLDSLDLKDKMVLMMTGTPDPNDTTQSMEGINKREMAKIGPLMMSGVKTIILTVNPADPGNKWFDLIKQYASGGSYKPEGDTAKEMPFNILFVDNSIADAVLKETGKTLAQIQQQIIETGKPASQVIKNATAEIILAKESKVVDGENIIGVVEGSDPKLKNEYVILTAHYDHVGITPDGQVNNGADDNGSGTVALLEVAEAFSLMKKKPERSIVFAWVTAEEKGLFGSRYYTENPVFPLSQTVANINLDMVGRSAPAENGPVTDVEKSLAGPDGVYFITGNKEGELRKIGVKISKKLNLLPSDELSEDFLNGSDYYHFHKNGIPVLGISTGLHEDYHHPTDEVAKIDYHKMKRIADLTFWVTLEIANGKKPLK